MTSVPPPDRPQRRHDPLRDAWVLVSAGRAGRPWRGQLEPEPAQPAVAHDPACELCPENTRASGIRNPGYAGTFVFDNDFPALVPARAEPSAAEGGPVDPAPSVLRAEDVAGVARVICFSPRHDASLATLSAAERRAVVDVWADQARDLGTTYPWIQVFENRGAAMGASNPHPHGQVWASSTVPTEAAREDATQRARLQRTGRALLDDVRAAERDGPRVVATAGDWLAIVPYWAAWPFETLVLAPPGVARLEDLDATARDDLAALLGELLAAYDALFDRPFPYSMGWHGAPGGGAAAANPAPDAHWRLHAHVYPPLLRADARKFMVGYELLAEPQRDLTPEDAAARLRAARTSAERSDFARPDAAPPGDRPP